MLSISEMVSVARQLDDEGHWSVANQAAVSWGWERPVFVRSSACHVFRARAEGSSSLLLRLRPYTGPGVEVLSRSARAAEALHAAGGPVSPAVPSLAGRRVEQPDGYAAMAMQGLAGAHYDDDEVDETVAQAWGAALARIHRAGTDAVVGRVPDTVSQCRLALEDLRGADSSGLRACADIIGELQELPVDPRVYGLLHGDPEIDNVVFTDQGATLVDLDDVRHGWFAADIGFALRDWAEIAAAPDLDAAVPRAFIAGYRTVRAVSDEELSWMPLLARAAGLETLGELQPALAESPEPDWPDWAHRLAQRVREREQQLRRALAPDPDSSD
jgi:Ser/Thr protein kinase RdoA (MazF antagonist)